MNEKPKSKPKDNGTRTKKGEAGEYVESMKVAAARWGIPVAVQKLAKAAGCNAFAGSRIKRAELEEWLKENPEAKGEGEALASEAELKRRKLQNEVTLGNLKIANEEKRTILREEAKNEWARCAAIVSEEAKLLMDKDAYRVFIDRVKAKTAEPFGE